jgi:two-component system CheB/CheR fusion protein
VDVTSLRAAEQLAQAHDRGGGKADDGTGEARTAERLQRATALRASALRDEFLSVMSHELKQPLNLIAVNAQVLSRLPELRASPVASRAVQTIHASVRGQSRIIEDLLDLSRMRTGKLELVRQPLDMAALVQAAAEMAAADASAGAIDVALEVPDSPVLVSADPVRLEQVIWNLLGNAVKFTPPGGRVTLALAVEGAHARLDVRDTGRGIAPAFLSRIFDMFDQGDGQDGRNRGGLGIGLALVRQLVELHGGRVAAHSGGPGHGTCMSVWLPLLEETPPAVTVDTSKLPAGVLTGLRILLVDDNPETVESLAMLLALEQAETLTATDGGTALRLAGERSGALDLLLTDIGMPGMDGYALAEAIHVLPGLQDLPVIALTGFGRSEGAGEAQRSGIAAQLVKPVTLDALVAAIDRVLGRPGSGA